MAPTTADQGALVVIPTRNRAELAMSAIRSVLDQPGCDVRVLVSDNSTAAEEADGLSRFCRGARDGRLHYVRPPEPLPMADHWNWAIGRALDHTDATHVAYLTDRMILKPGELKNVISVAAEYPDRLVTYNDDKVLDHVRPVRLVQLPWTGAILEVQAERMLLLSSRAVVWCNEYPRMLNCVAPRGLLNALRERFGTVFASVSPDYCFCYRCLSLIDAYIHYDKTVMVQYALHRSNGVSSMKGTTSPDRADFLATSNLSNSAAPIPGLVIGMNAIFHEYCRVKEETHSARLPEVDMAAYLRALWDESAHIEDDRVRREVRATLEQHGRIGSARATSADGLPGTSGWAVGSRAKSAIARFLYNWPTKSLWLLLARRWGVLPVTGNGFRFATTEEALDYAVRFPRKRSSDFRHVGRLQPRVLSDSCAGAQSECQRRAPHRARVGVQSNGDPTGGDQRN